MRILNFAISTDMPPIGELVSKEDICDYSYKPSHSVLIVNHM